MGTAFPWMFFCGNGVPVNVCQALICNWPLSAKILPLCVKMALICKNWVKVRVRVRVRVRVSVSSLYRQGPHFYR